MAAATPVCICWFRRDLRLQDNAAFYRALKSGLPVVPVFIFDKAILDKLQVTTDARVSFIYDTLAALKQELEKQHSTLFTYYGEVQEVWKTILSEFNVQAVYCNEDYEPSAIKRDQQVAKDLAKENCSFFSFKDQVIFSKSEVVKDDGLPYTVFTPYSKKWKAKLNDFYLKSYPSETLLSALYHYKPATMPSLAAMGFEHSNLPIPALAVNKSILQSYDQTRDFPAIAGTSKLGIHLRFGTISVRQLARTAISSNAIYLNELIWREFYQQILYHFPHVVDHAFKPAYDNIQWLNNEKQFEAWCTGQTGYPIVDAGMRELNATGYMHNRVRMITASFLTKHLLIDWRWGEQYFAERLLDFDLASNNGGWQWAASSGCDAAPYFRVFNPTLQTQRFDPQLAYCRKWVPELDSFNYPTPIVNHEMARKRVLEVYKKALG